MNGFWKLHTRSQMISSNVLMRERRSNNFTGLFYLRQQATKATRTEKEIKNSNPYFGKYQEKLDKLKRENPAMYLEKMGALVGENDIPASNPTAESSNKKQVSMNNAEESSRSIRNGAINSGHSSL